MGKWNWKIGPKWTYSGFEKEYEFAISDLKKPKIASIKYEILNFILRFELFYNEVSIFQSVIVVPNLR